METFVDVAKALSDPGRVRILAALRGRELCVCQIVELLGLAVSTVSKHMAVLRQAGLVASRKEGRWVYYRRAEPCCDAAAGALRWCDAVLAGDPQLADDAARVESILCTPLVELCRP